LSAHLGTLAAMRRITITIAAAALAVSACAGDDGATDTPSDPSISVATTAASPTTTTSTAPPATEAGTVASPGDTTTTAPPAGVGDDTTPTPETTAPPPADTTAPDVAIPLEDTELALIPVASGFLQPVFLDAPAGDARLFIVDQPGTIHVLSEGGSSVFLDLTERVAFRGEQGLLGMAFHPEFGDNGRFFVHYTGLDGATRLEEYRVSGDPDAADPASGRLVFGFPQPASNHNGGMIAFGPDGHLYVALGDGGGAGDRYGNGQDRETPLGAILRLDVDSAEPYAIPPENPYADGGGAPEIWAIGLRNPWRFSFDGDAMWIGDVGQDAWEEIDRVDHRDRGLNLGWPIMEGSRCFAADDCDTGGLTLPIHEYPHGDGSCSVTGGYVYRGSAVPQLQGAYFFGDYCTGRISSFFVDPEGVYAERQWPGLTTPGLTSFGTDGFGELYVIASAGEVYRVGRRG